MKLLSISTAIFITFLSASKCTESQNAQITPPIPIGEVYVEEWASPIKSGGSGFNLFIPIDTKPKSSVVFDSVYYRNQGTKLVKKVTDSMTIYIGQFKNPQKNKGDIIMSSDPMEEMKNNVPEVVKKSPFKLENGECMVSYIDGNEVKYFHIENIVQNQTDKSPRAKQNRQ